MSRNKWVLLSIAFGFVLFGAFMLQSLRRGADLRESYSELKELRVFTHSSFMSSYGPGPLLAQEFEVRCKCKVKFINVGSGGLLIERLKLKPEEHVDLVIGLDQLSVEKAYEEVVWKAIDFPRVNMKKEIQKRVLKWFMPYDYSPMTFIYRKNEKPPLASWEELLNDKFQLSLQDPRTSTPGMQFLMWLYTRFGKNEAMSFLQKLKKNIHSVSPNWSAAYGLFKSGQANLTFSYLTSVVYHWVEENDENYQAIVFDEGHPLQIEYAAVPNRCINCKMAQSFVKFMLESKSQKVLMQKNYMLPVLEGVEAGTPFENLPEVKALGLDKVQIFNKDRESVLRRWESVFRQNAG